MTQRVLLIDDSSDVHVQVRLLLAGEPIDVTTAESGAAGMAAAVHQPPDVILLDVDMPTPDGFEVCRMLKADPALANVPIVFLTGMTSTTEKIRGLNLGAVDYVTKPFDPAELRARVNAALRTKYMVDLLAQRALLDGLTGLWNRAYFDQRLAAEVALCQRHERRLGCILIDIDHFKTVNDTYGHPAGDHVLREVARTLTAAVRSEDIVARIGGEEFGVLAPCTPPGGTVVLAERLRTTLQCQQFGFRGWNINVTCSFGVADTTVNPVPMEASGLVDRADLALYQAKRAGRNRVTAA